MGEDGYFEYYVCICEYAKEKCLNFFQHTEHVLKASGDGGGGVIKEDGRGRVGVGG